MARLLMIIGLLIALFVFPFITIPVILIWLVIKIVPTLAKILVPVIIILSSIYIVMHKPIVLIILVPLGLFVWLIIKIQSHPNEKLRKLLLGKDA